MNTHLLKPPSHLDTDNPTHLSIPLDGLASLVEDGDVVRRVVVAKEHRHLDLTPELWPGKKKGVKDYKLEGSNSLGSED